ncbi:Protein lev-9 [Nymphon striatum]|nr:Protein lev-9 [Nymphon striatum]
MVEEKMGCKRELVTGIGQRKMRFAGHVLRGSSGELANLVLEGTIDGKRDREKLGVMMSRIGQELETWEMQKGKLKIKNFVLCHQLYQMQGHNAPADKEDFEIDTMVQYTCGPGYQNQGFLRAKCLNHNGTAQWFGPDLQCAPVSCNDPGNLTYGERDVKSFKFTDKVTYRCKPGYEMIGRTERYCQATRQWSGTMPTCKAVECEIPTDPINGKAFVTNLTYDATVRYECRHRYKLVGNETRKCGADRKWTETKPHCTEIDCGYLGELHNGYYEMKNSLLGSVVTFHCNDGSRFEGHNQTICQQDEKWSNHLPACLLPCRPPFVQYGFINESKRNFKDGENATANCNNLYEIENYGDETVTCRNGSWSGKLICIEARCKKLPKKPKNGFVIAPKTYHGMQARFRCRDGFQLSGNDTTECHFGNWTGQAPNCTVGQYHNSVHCSYPGKIKNGRVLIVGNFGFYDYRPYITTTKNDKQILYECFKGYRRLPGGPSGATCIRGIWSPRSQPKCVPDQVTIYLKFDKNSNSGKIFNNSKTVVAHPHLLWIRSLKEIYRTRREAVKQKKLKKTQPPRSGYCENPGNLKNGLTHYVGRFGNYRVMRYFNNFRNNSQILFECLHGFKLFGHSNSTCVEGNWSPPDHPECIISEVQVDNDDHSLPKIFSSGGAGASSGAGAPSPTIKPNPRQSRRRRHKNRRSKINPDRRKNKKSRKGAKGKNKKGNRNTLCPALQNTPTMKLFGSNPNQTIFESGEATVVCGGGFGLNLRNSTVHCVRGRWRPHTPKCIPLKCKVPTTDHGIYKAELQTVNEGSDVKHGRDVVFTCNAGYVRHGAKTLKCWYGSWSVDEYPQCTPAACLLPDIPNGNYLDGYRGGFNVAHGSVLTYTCQEGYFQVTSKPLECHMGNLTPLTPKCVREDQKSTSSFASCNVPLVEDGSYHTGNQELMPTQSVQHDVYITLSCNTGFIQNGNENFKCKFGEWATNDLPKCVPGPCTLAPIQNGRYTEQYESGSNVSHGQKITYLCDENYVPDTIDPLVCHKGKLTPIRPQCTSSDGQVDVASSVKELARKMARNLPSTMQSNSSSMLSSGGFHRPCRAPYKVENTLLYKGNEVINGDPTEHIYRHGIIVRYECVIGIHRERTTWTITCDDGIWVGRSQKCADDGFDMQNKSCQFRNTEPYLVAFDGDSIVTGNLTEFPAETVLVFRCKDIGKFSMIGSVRRKCMNGEWDGIKPACFGLSQENDYALEKPPTILFRHQLGPIAQTNDGKLLVYPGTIVHLECLWIRKYGKPLWKISHKYRKYPEGWASEGGRDMNLEYRLSIYHAQQGDSGRFTCVTPMGHKHSVQIVVATPECPILNNITSNKLTIKTISSLEGMKLVFTCQSGYILNGSSELWCTTDNQWLMPFPSCHAPKCPEMNNFTIGNLMMNTIKNNLGMKLTFTCKAGFVLKGRRQVMCDSSGQWPQPYPTCHDVGCEKPSLPENGFIQGKRTGSYKAGDVVLFGCNQGYMMESKGVTVCQESGLWSRPIPNCVQACTYPGTTTGSTISVVKFYYRIGENVTFDCSQGMRLQGRKMLRCELTGLWSSAIPRCIST